LKNGKESKLSQSSLLGERTAAVFAAGRGHISGILNFAGFVSGSLPGKV